MSTVASLGRVAKATWSENREEVLGIVAIGLAVARETSPWFAVPQAAVTGLLILDVVQSARRIAFCEREKHVPLVACIGVSADAAQDMLAQVEEVVAPLQFNAARFERAFGFGRHDWALLAENALTAHEHDWANACRSWRHRMEQPIARLPGCRKIVHVFLRCPAALAVGLGALVGVNRLAVIHHYQPGAAGIADTPYRPVVDVAGSHATRDPRLLRQEVNGYQHITVEAPESLTGEIYVSLQAASHAISAPWSAMAEEAGASLVSITANRDVIGALDPTSDWTPMVREIRSALAPLLAHGRVHLALSVPVALAFPLGMALGTQPALDVYHYFSETQSYKRVLSLDALRAATTIA